MGELFDVHVMSFDGERTASVAALQRLFGIEKPQAARLVRHAPVVVKRGATEQEARSYVEAMSSIGARVALLPAESAPAASPPPGRPRPPPPPPPGRRPPPVPVAAARASSLSVVDPMPPPAPAAPPARAAAPETTPSPSPSPSPPPSPPPFAPEPAPVAADAPSWGGLEMEPGPVDVPSQPAPGPVFDSMVDEVIDAPLATPSEPAGAPASAAATAATMAAPLPGVMDPAPDATLAAAVPPSQSHVDEIGNASPAPADAGSPDPKPRSIDAHAATMAIRPPAIAAPPPAGSLAPPIAVPPPAVGAMAVPPPAVVDTAPEPPVAPEAAPAAEPALALETEPAAEPAFALELDHAPALALGLEVEPAAPGLGVALEAEQASEPEPDELPVLVEPLWTPEERTASEEARRVSIARFAGVEPEPTDTLLGQGEPAPALDLAGGLDLLDASAVPALPALPRVDSADGLTFGDEPSDHELPIAHGSSIPPALGGAESSIPPALAMPSAAPPPADDPPGIGYAEVSLGGSDVSPLGVDGDARHDDEPDDDEDYDDEADDDEEPDYAHYSPSPRRRVREVGMRRVGSAKRPQERLRERFAPLLEKAGLAGEPRGAPYAPSSSVDPLSGVRRWALSWALILIGWLPLELRAEVGDPTRAESLALGGCALGVLALGVVTNNTILHGTASGGWLVLHVLALHALAMAARAGVLERA